MKTAASMTQPSTPTTSADATRGFYHALMAYGFWGFLPLYMKAVAHISPLEVVAHDDLEAEGRRDQSPLLLDVVDFPSS